MELAHTLTLHLRSRTFPTRAAHASTVRLLADLADRAAGRTPAVGGRPITSVCPLTLFAAADMFRRMQHAPKSRSHHTAGHCFTVSPVPAPPVWPGPCLVDFKRLVRFGCTCRLSSNQINLCRPGLLALLRTRCGSLSKAMHMQDAYLDNEVERAIIALQVCHRCNSPI